MARIHPGWRGTIEAVHFDLLDTSELNARNMRGPDQCLHNPIPRAHAFITAKHLPVSVPRKSSPKGRVAILPDTA